MSKFIESQVEELDERLDRNLTEEDKLDIYEDAETSFHIRPNSTSYKDGYTIFNSPFYFLMKDKYFDESIPMSVTLEQAIQIRDFLSEKIEEVLR